LAHCSLLTVRRRRRRRRQVMDCCHSGTGMDLPFCMRERQAHQWVTEDNPCFCLGDARLFSGCEDSQTSVTEAPVCLCHVNDLHDCHIYIMLRHTRDLLGSTNNAVLTERPWGCLTYVGAVLRCAVLMCCAVLCCVHAGRCDRPTRRQPGCPDEGVVDGYERQPSKRVHERERARARARERERERERESLCACMCVRARACVPGLLG
jgi:hypothetical protein